MKILYKHTWPSIFTGFTSIILVTEECFYFQRKTKDLDEVLLAHSSSQGVKKMSIEEINYVEWDAECCRIFIKGKSAKLIIPFPRKLKGEGLSCFEKLGVSILDLSETRKEKASFESNHSSAILTLLGYSCMATILAMLKGTDVSDFNGRKKVIIEMSVFFANTIGYMGIMGLFILGVFFATRKYLKREKEPMYVFRYYKK